MKISNGQSALAILVGAISLLSCGPSSTINEKTTFTHIDSLTETYLSLQDTLLYSWNVLVKDEQEKLDAVNASLLHLKKEMVPNPSQLTSLDIRFEQLKHLHITQKSLTNPYVIEEYDFAFSSLISELLAITESNPTIAQDLQLINHIDKIKFLDQRILINRIGYDSVANELNLFIEQNKLKLNEIETTKSLEKRPVFNAATIH